MVLDERGRFFLHIGAVTEVFIAAAGAAARDARAERGPAAMLLGYCSAAGSGSWVAAPTTAGGGGASVRVGNVWGTRAATVAFGGLCLSRTSRLCGVGQPISNLVSAGSEKKVDEPATRNGPASWRIAPV